MITTQKELRAAFWERYPEFKNEYRKTYRQNQYRTGIRCSWVDFVDHMRRDGQISEALANRATL